MNKELRREEIIKFSKPLFAQNGYRSVSIEDILKSCKIAQGTLYLHFSGKHEIFREIVMRALGDIQKIIAPVEKDALADNKGGSFSLFDYIKTKNQRFFKAVQKDKEIFRILLLESSGISPEINSILITIFNAIQNQIETELTMFQTMGLLGEVNIKLAVQTVIGSIIMTIMNNCLGDEEPDIPFLAEEITKLQLFGYSKKNQV